MLLPLQLPGSMCKWTLWYRMSMIYRLTFSLKSQYPYSSQFLHISVLYLTTKPIIIITIWLNHMINSSTFVFRAQLWTHRLSLIVVVILKVIIITIHWYSMFLLLVSFIIEILDFWIFLCKLGWSILDWEKWWRRGLKFELLLLYLVEYLSVSLIISIWVLISSCNCKLLLLLMIRRNVNWST